MKYCNGCLIRNADFLCHSCARDIMHSYQAKPDLGIDTFAESFVTNLNTSSIEISANSQLYFVELKKNQLGFRKKPTRYLLSTIDKHLSVLNRHYIPANRHLSLCLANEVFTIQTMKSCLVESEDKVYAQLIRVEHTSKKGVNPKMLNLGESYPDIQTSIFTLFSRVQKTIPTYKVLTVEIFKRLLFNTLLGMYPISPSMFTFIEEQSGVFRLSHYYEGFMPSLHYLNKLSDTIQDYPNTPTLSYFEELGTALQIIPKHLQKILLPYQSAESEIVLWIEKSFLSDELKQEYANYLLKKLKALQG